MLTVYAKKRSPKTQNKKKQTKNSNHQMFRWTVRGNIHPAWKQQKYQRESILDTWHPYILILDGGWKSQVGIKLPFVLASAPCVLSSPSAGLAISDASFICHMVVMMPYGVMFYFVLPVHALFVLCDTLYVHMLPHGYASSGSLWWLIMICST